MKTIKQLKEEYDNIVLDQMQSVSDELVLEGRERDTGVIKASSKAIPSLNDMPSMLMFRRVAYRMYPNKQVVALYYSKFVNKYLSIPFGPDGNLNLSEAIVHDDLEEGAGLEALKGGLKGAAKGAFKGHVYGAAVGAGPGAALGTVVGGAVGAYKGAKKGYEKGKAKEMNEDWSDAKYKSPSGGLTPAGVMRYRRENPGSKLQTAVTTKPSKLKKGSKAANRRKSFCARMGGMKKRLTSAKTARDPDSRINKALRKWNCEESFNNKLAALREERQVNEFVLPLVQGAARLALGAAAGEALYQGAKQAVKAGARGLSKLTSKVKAPTKAPTKAPKTPSKLGTAAAAGTGAAVGSSAGSAASAPEDPFSSATKALGTGLIGSKTGTKSKSSREFAPYRSLTPTQQSRYTANILAKENKISEIQNMINEGVDNMNLSINGRTVTLNNSMAKKIIRVYESVNNKNKKIVENMLNEDLDSFKKLLNFSIKA